MPYFFNSIDLNSSNNSSFVCALLDFSSILLHFFLYSSLLVISFFIGVRNSTVSYAFFIESLWLPAGWDIDFDFRWLFELDAIFLFSISSLSYCFDSTSDSVLASLLSKFSEIALKLVSGKCTSFLFALIMVKCK